MSHVLRHFVTGALMAPLIALPTVAWSQQTTGAPELKVAVIDVGRLVTDSLAGKKVLAALQKISDDKSAGLKTLADELEGLQTQITEGRLSLSETRISELKRELEDKSIAFRRARDDADRQLQELQASRFGEIERLVMPIINEVGSARGYMMIFNKFESGLVYARDGADITNEILQRFDASTQADEANAADDATSEDGTSSEDGGS